MDRGKKSSEVVKAAMRLLAPQGVINPPVPVKLSENREWKKIMIRIMRISPFPKKQKKLLMTLAERGSLDLHDISAVTDSHDPKSLIRDTNRTIKSSQYIKNLFSIGSSRKGKSYEFQLRWNLDD